MTRRLLRRLLLPAAVMLLLVACAPAGQTEETGALTWGTGGNYGRHQPFLELLHKTCPDIELEFVSYAGGNATGYSWAQMRADDIPDIFITSQILDETLAEERLIDLSGYGFVNGFSTAILDQVAIDGGVYLLPVNSTMYGIYYNKTLMEEKGWEVPSNLAELEALCAQIRAEGLIPGVVGTMLTGGPFSAVFNLAKTSWLTTPEGIGWERDFLAGAASAEGRWEGTMELVQRYIDMGMFTADPEDRINVELIGDYLGGRKAVFCTAVQPVSYTVIPDTGDELGMMPYIGEDGSKNVYMYSPFCYFGISRRLTEPGNEKKLENAVRILNLLFSPEGQAAFITEQTPCVISVLDSAALPEDALISDARRALREGRAFPMTYAGWESVLADMGQAYKEWFRGENGVDGPQCIARMDALQQGLGKRRRRGRGHNPPGGVPRRRGAVRRHFRQTLRGENQYGYCRRHRPQPRRGIRCPHHDRRGGQGPGPGGLRPCGGRQSLPLCPSDKGRWGAGGRQDLPGGLPDEELYRGDRGGLRSPGGERLGPDFPAGVAGGAGDRVPRWKSLAVTKPPERRKSVGKEAG